jgi:DnaJ-class molecular chaperone
MNEFEDVPTLSLLRTIENISAELKRRRVVAPEKRDAQQRKPAICRACQGSGIIGHMNPGDGMADTSSECSKCGGTGRRSGVA